MKALVLNQNTYQFEVRRIDKPQVLNFHVLIRIKAAAINHHELWTLREKELKSDSDIILGSDGAGIIEEVGEDVKHFRVGDEVIINPSINWGTNDRVHSREFEILGCPTRGTFSQFLLISEKYVYRKPMHLSFPEAAALPLAGLTAYRALFTRGELEANNTVLITGIGGGAALFALSFALAARADVYVTSGNSAKLSRAVKLGAKGGVNYRDNTWGAQLKAMVDGFDVIVDSAAGKGFRELTEQCRPGGRIALFGRTAGHIPDLDPKTIFWKQLSIHGTTMGNDREFEEMLALVASKKISPVIDSVFPAGNINAAFEKMDKGEQFGKIIISMEDL
jgi:NADPH:quinone reductase-like Zn-dependent oxidoreductase